MSYLFPKPFIYGSHFPFHKHIHIRYFDCNYLASLVINTSRPRQHGRHFADDTFKRIFMNENVRISINISLKFVSKGLFNNIPVLVQIMAWRRSGDKPLSEPMMVNLLTHICVTRPQWVNICVCFCFFLNNFQDKYFLFNSWGRDLKLRHLPNSAHSSNILQFDLKHEITDLWK